MPHSSGRQTAQKTAEIIPFRKRSSTGSAAAHETVRDRAERAGLTLCDYGSGWYHDAAMQEELAQLRKH